jgi:hypothetical protein
MWEHQAHPELRAVLRRLEAKYGSRLRVLRSDPEWLTFEVVGLTSENIIRQLEREQQHLFGAQALHHQVLMDLAGRDRGVSVKYVAGLSPSTGFWYY